MKKVIPSDACLIPKSAKCVFEGLIYDVFHWQQPLFDGSSATFEMLRRADTVSAICLVDEKVLLLKEEQPHRGERISFPGGRVEKTDSSALTAIQREVLEETGYSFKNWRLVQVTQPFTKIEWFVHIFVAWDIIELTKPLLDPGEKISVDTVLFDETKKKVMDKTGYLGESADLFKNSSSGRELTELPEFEGKLVDR